MKFYNYKSLTKKFTSSINNNNLIVPTYTFNTSKILFTSKNKQIPVFRVLDSNGNKINSIDTSSLSKETAVKMLQTMVRINVYDEILYKAQRQGKISFYMSCEGEEAAVVGSIAGLKDIDSIYPQYREAAALLYRGYTTKQMTSQLTGNTHDLGKGRQMPVHYGSNKLNYQTVSSPLATQIPQAAGAGYLFSHQKQDRICLTYFGEGAASEGDFHAGMNFAAVLNSQTIFFCRNNGYAISTSTQDQYAGDGIAAKGVGYGMNTIRVDGNDAVAVYLATQEARKYCVTERKPVLIEAMTYRQSNHSTSDEAIRYRPKEVLDRWKDYLAQIGNPIKRFTKYCTDNKYINDSFIKEHIDKYTEDITLSLKESIADKRPSVDSMFDDVWDILPKNLIKQKQELKEHLKKYGEHYELNKYQ